jgi:hypothetical protein
MVRAGRGIICGTVGSGPLSKLGGEA